MLLLEKITPLLRNGIIIIFEVVTKPPLNNTFFLILITIFFLQKKKFVASSCGLPPRTTTKIPVHLSTAVEENPVVDLL